MTGRRRHRWGERSPVSDAKTERECLNGCGVVKVTRHQGNRHWQEFWRGYDKLAGDGDPTPPCIEPSETRGD